MLTVDKLFELDAKYNLGDFEIRPLARMRWEGDRELVLRKPFSSIGSIEVRISTDTCKITRQELQIKDESNCDCVCIKLTDEQLKDLASALI